MKILPATSGIDAALSVLRSGGIVAHATETCYGLACDLSNPAAVKRLFLIKNRPPHQPVSALFASLEQAKQYVIWNERAEELAKEFLPGPVTIVLLMNTEMPTNISPMPMQLRISSANSSIRNPQSLGVRLSPHPIAAALATRFGSPISTTSANVHGQPNPYSVADLLQQFEGREFQPDLVLDSGELPKTPPSRVIDLSSGSDEKILRR